MASVTYYRPKRGTGQWHLMKYPRGKGGWVSQCWDVFTLQEGVETTTTPPQDLICRRCERGDNHERTEHGD
jgi:hypothetical protein